MPRLFRAPRARPSTDPLPYGIRQFYGPENGTVNVDIVFIHGLAGDRDKTWTAPNESQPWPKTLLPSKFPAVRILTFGYDAHVTNWKGGVSRTRIENHAWNLLTSLGSYRDEDDTNERPIIFVCHSLGGLVCEDALATSRQRTERHLRSIFHSTRAIAFLGTPHQGSDLATWAERLTRYIDVIRQANPQILRTLKRDSEVLARIQGSFHNMIRARSMEGLQPIEITCFYEELPVPGIGLIVPQHSATIPGYIPIGIHSNHMDMAKFVSVDDPGFRAVSSEVLRWIKGLQGAGPDHETAPSSSNEKKSNSIGGACQNPLRGVPASNNFVDRPSDMAQLERCLLPPPRPRIARQRIFVLYGLGGVGKTQLAVDFVRRHQATFSSVFWLDGRSEDRLRQSLADCAKRIPQGQISDRSRNVFQNGVNDLNTLVADVLGWLARPDNDGWLLNGWLLIFDNVDKEYDLGCTISQHPPFSPDPIFATVFNTTSYINTPH